MFEVLVGAAKRKRVCVGVVVAAAGGLSAVPGTASAASKTSSAASRGVPASVGRELPQMRTRTSKTFVDEQGHFTARVYPGSANYQAADGSWLPIDSNLIASGGGFAPKAAAYGLELPKTLSAGAVKVSDSGRWVSFQMIGAKASKATVAGKQASYASVLKGVNATYTAGNDALKEDLTLVSAASARTFSYRLTSSAGLTPKLRDSGIVEFDDADGRTYFTLGAPNMTDAAGVESRAVTHGLVKTAQGYKLTTTAQDAWLNQAGRKFPVKVDPGASPLSDPDCSLDEDTPSTSGCMTAGLKVGRQSGKEHRAIMRFAVAEALPRDAEVFNAAVAIYARTQTSPTLTPTSVVVQRLTHSWTTGAGWDRYDGVNRWGSPGGDFASNSISEQFDKVGGTNGVGYTYFLNIGTAVSDWHTQKYPNYGLVVRAYSPEDNLITFDSSETAGGSAPFLSIQYQRRLGERPGYKLESFQLNDRTALKVNPATGNLLLRQTDMTIPGGLGPDTTVGRTYNSYQPGPSGPSYGQGWTMDTAAGVFLENQGNFYQELFGPSGWGVLFQPYTDTNGKLAWRTPPGIDGTLIQDAANQKILTLRKSQTKYVFESVAANVKARLLRIEDRNGRKVSFTYDGTSQRVATITDNQDRVSTFLYDTSSRVTKMTDPAGRNYAYTYDATSGLLATYTDPAAGVSRYFYDTLGRINKVTTPGNRSTTVAYYPSTSPDVGKVKSVTRVTNQPNTGDGPTTSFVYEPHRDTSSAAYVTDPLGHETRYTFDTSSRITDVNDALGNKTATSYDSRSNVETYSAPGSTTGSANLTRNSFDGDGNLTGTATPTTSTPVASSGKAIRTAANYPPNGTTGPSAALPTSSTDPQGKVTAYSYDANGNPTNIAQQGNAAASVSLTYSATAPGRVDKSTDGLGKDTLYGYDAKGNLTSIAPPAASMGTTSLSYGGHSGADQALSRISSITRPAAGTETYDYDALDRVIKVTYSDGTSVTSTYDPDGNLTQAVDTATGAGTRTLTYDLLNRLLTQNGPGTTTYSYRYDASSNLASVQDNNGTTEYGYDAANRGVSVYQPGVAAPVKYTLDDRGNRIKIELPNGVTTEQGFNEASQLARTCTRPTASDTACSASTASRLLDFAYTYQERTGSTGQGMSVGELQESVTDKDNKLTLNCYDDLNRVARVETGTTTTPPAGCIEPGPALSSSDWFAYAFDLAGNITGSQRKGQTQRTFAYADGNRLCWSFSGTSSNTCGTPPAGAIAYSYNTAGQETAVSGGRSSIYNARRQLSSTTGVTGITAFGTGQDDLLTAGGNTHRSGVLGLSQIGADSYVRDESGGLVSQNVSGSRKYVHTDSLGSVRALTDSAGTVITRLDYDPYGTPTSTATPGPSTSRFGYAQGEAIGAGLYHYGQRYYDPNLMRWTQPDPLLNAGDLRQANRYQYVGGDPVNVADPSGLLSLSVRVGAFAGLGGEVGFSVDTKAGISVDGSLGVGYGAQIRGKVGGGSVSRTSAGPTATGCLGACVGKDYAAGTNRVDDLGTSYGIGFGANAGVSGRYRVR